MKRVPYVSIILKNAEGEVLLLLRDNRSTIENPNHGTLVGGNVEEKEFAEMAAHRELEQETGFKPAEIRRLKIGYSFKALTNEYFLSHR